MPKIPSDIPAELLKDPSLENLIKRFKKSEARQPGGMNFIYIKDSIASFLTIWVNHSLIQKYGFDVVRDAMEKSIRTQAAQKAAKTRRENWLKKRQFALPFR